MKTYKLADDVLARLAQILQEALLQGVDIVDIMRMMDLQEDGQEPGKLVLTDAYKAMVKAQHDSMLQFAQEMQAKHGQA